MDQQARAQSFKEHVFDPSDVVTLITGKHILHFGGEVLIYRNDSLAWGAGHQSGAFSFGSSTCSCDNDYTAHGRKLLTDLPALTPALAGRWPTFCWEMLLAGVHPGMPEYGARLKSPQFFIQDDYKVRPNLTVNLGLRYQINHGWNEVHGNVDSFDPTVMNPATNTLGAMWFASTHANGRTSLEEDVYNTFLPRVGFSWLPSPKTTLRGGFGLYAYNWSADNYGQNLGRVFGASGSANDTTGGVTPITKLDGPGNKLCNWHAAAVYLE